MSDIKPESINVTCDANFPTESAKVGVFANAFRVIRDTGNEFFLDFLTYSASEQHAVVMARVRIHKDLLGPMSERLTAVLTDVTSIRQPLVLIPKPPDDGDVN